MMTNTPSLETERLILRRFTDDDLPDFYRIYSNEQVVRFLPMNPVRSMGEAGEFFRGFYCHNYMKEWGCDYALCLRSDNRIAGFINVDDECGWELGYGLLPEYWHQGLMSEACTAVLSHLKDQGIPFIYATHDVNNPASGRIMERLGMKYQYSYKEQWQPADILVTFRLYLINLDGNEERTFTHYWDRSEVRMVEPGL